MDREDINSLLDTINANLRKVDDNQKRITEIMNRELVGLPGDTIVTAMNALRYLYTTNKAMRDKYMEMRDDGMAIKADGMMQVATRAWRKIWNVLRIRGDTTRSPGIFIQEVYDAFVAGLDLESRESKKHEADITEIMSEHERKLRMNDRKLERKDEQTMLELFWGQLVSGCINQQCDGDGMEFVRGEPGEMAGPGLPGYPPNWFCETCEAEIRVQSVSMESRIVDWFDENDVREVL